ncbi:MAG: hypothetical protein IKB51_02905 [Clostridia bacterium]|nr:hypothetical protein [Clostridia bacterium]
MAFPRLIFVNEKTPVSCEADVITDLKLDLIFPPEVSDYLILAPERETLMARREMFKALLSDDSSEARLREALDKLLAARELYRAMTAAVSEKTASFVFVHLILKLSELCESVRALNGYGALLERFCGAFAEISEKVSFQNAVSEASELKKRLAAISALTLKTDGESAVISAPRGEGMTEALRACAAELDISLGERPRSSITLQKGVAEALGTVYPEELNAAAELLSKYRTLVTGEIIDYIPELEFVIGIVSFTKKAADNGLPYCFPEITERKGISLRNVYDVTLLKKEGSVIVPNDVEFTEKEPFFYLTGANGGGKTTYIRAVGGAMLLLLAGAPVFCEGGQASILSAVYTHFPKDERFEGTGRFLDEKNRVDLILEKQDGNALILLNETFSTTGEEKAIEQTDILARTLYKSGNLGLYITHQHDVSEKEIPFLGVTVDENDRNRRTYKIEKRRLPPRSFANDILEKYGLDKNSLKARFGG